MPRREPESEGSARAVRQRIATAHRHLDALFVRTLSALRRGEVGPAARDLDGLCEALEAHFLQEENLYYPPIVSLRPDTKVALEAAIHAHAEFRTSLRTIAELLAQGHHAEAVRAFDAFTAAFARHEVAEERALRVI
jgi:hypothetical protein